ERSLALKLAAPESLQPAPTVRELGSFNDLRYPPFLLVGRAIVGKFVLEADVWLDMAQLRGSTRSLAHSHP
ncbi:hypothetical protein, partial [uncultured Caballeronia sp.]|uniref:hypothetical protein n=1 Tax=uncultured Caballeronia sp. TaxID=1827198 RepID=UPI0035C9E272